MSRAADVFADALDLPRGRRAAFLDRACGDDAALRAEVDSLLAHHAPASGFLDSVTDDAHRPLVLPNGTRIGAWRIVSFIAAGGMGAVYLAERADGSFVQRAALKLIAPTLGSHAVLDRFRTERQVLASLEHPSIARLIDGGSTSDGAPYMVMEYVDGLPIDAYCREHALDLRARLRVFAAVCDAVQYAHRHLVIHRDLKPGNISVDRSGTPKLLDFGLAKVLDTSADTAATMMHAMTPRYASPEQVRRGSVTTLTDVYSLGVVLYEVVTNARPYTVETATPSEIERAVCIDAPVPPSRHVPRLPRDVECIVLRALAKEPERRYATAEEFGADIRRFLAGDPVTARPDTVAYRLSRFVRRNALLVASVAAILCTLVVALVLVARGYQRERWSAYRNALSAAESALTLGQVSEARASLASAPVALRGWEWRHLAARLDRSERSWSGHPQAIVRIATARDARTVLTCGLDSVARLWDVTTGAKMHEWRFGATVESGVVLADGARAFLGLGDGRAVIVPLAGDAPAETLATPGEWAMVDASADGSLLAAGFFGGQIVTWDGRSLAQRRSWSAPGGTVVVACDPLGRYLVSGDGRGNVRMWDARTGALRATLPSHASRVFALAISRDGARIASGSSDRVVHVWDVASRSIASTLHEHRATIVGLAFDVTGDVLYTASADGRVLAWNAARGTLRAELRGQRSDPSTLAVTGDGRRVVAAEWDGTVRVWNTHAADVRITPAGREQVIIPRVLAAAYDERTAQIVCTTEADRVAILPLASRDSVRTLAVDGDLAGAVWVANATTVLVAMKSGTLRTEQRALLAGRPVRAVAANADGSLLAEARDDSTIRVRRWPSLALVDSCRTTGTATRRLLFAPDGRTLASACTDGSVWLLSVDGTRARRVVHAFTGNVRDVCFSHDSRWIAAVGDSNVVRVWDVRSGRHRADFTTRESRFGAVAFSRDGSRIAVGAGQVIALFDVRRRSETARLHGHVAAVSWLTFARGDSLLLSGSYDGTVRVWDAPRATTAFETAP